MSHPRVGLHITNAHEPAVPGKGTYYALLGAGEIYILHITNAHEPEVGRVRVHITPFSVLREMGALDQGHI